MARRPLLAADARTPLPMPHVVIEYSHGLEQAYSINELLATAVHAATDSGVMDESDIKARAMPYHQFHLADGGRTFVHVTVRLLAGRTAQEKLHLSSLIRERVVAFAPLVHSTSVEISDMDPACYRKRVLREA
jgi:5-carboxymethyl-2-hydroxymuconate isomerase